MAWNAPEARRGSSEGEKKEPTCVAVTGREVAEGRVSRAGEGEDRAKGSVDVGRGGAEGGEARVERRGEELEGGAVVAGERVEDPVPDRRLHPSRPRLAALQRQHAGEHAVGAPTRRPLVTNPRTKARATSAQRGDRSKSRSPLAAAASPASPLLSSARSFSRCDRLHTTLSPPHERVTVPPEPEPLNRTSDAACCGPAAARAHARRPASALALCSSAAVAASAASSLMPAQTSFRRSAVDASAAGGCGITGAHSSETPARADHSHCSKCECSLRPPSAAHSLWNSSESCRTLARPSASHTGTGSGLGSEDAVLRFGIVSSSRLGSVVSFCAGAYFSFVQTTSFRFPNR